jgi:hypothetical protein
MKITAELYDKAVRDEEFWSEIYFTLTDEDVEIDDFPWKEFDEMMTFFFVVVDGMRRSREIAELKALKEVQGELL